MGKTQILLVDADLIARQELTRLINRESDLVVCAQASDAAQALETLEKQQVDLAIVDVSLEGTNGVQLTQKIKAQYANLPVLVLTIRNDALYTKQALQAGARGCIIKHEPPETLLTAIRRLSSGKDYVSETVVQTFLKGLHSKG